MPNEAAPALAATVIASLQPAISAAAESHNTDSMSEITVEARRIANERPAATFATAVTALRYDPLTDVQSRGLAEDQADVTVRGGLFENTGFKLGAVTITDPQTGHYVAGLPVDPALLSNHRILTGIDNAIAGFNSSVATVDYGFRETAGGGAAALGAGSDNLNFQTLRHAMAGTAANGDTVGGAVSLARAEGNGTVPNGDREFTRYNLHLQRGNERGQTDLLLAYQHKFYGWPGAYTGFASLPETDDTHTALLVANHRHRGRNGWWEAGAYFRGLEDDYDFDRRTEESGGPGAFDHETRSYGAGFQALMRAGRVDWRFGGQAGADEIARSTDLTAGTFDHRSYLTLTAVPSMEFVLTGENVLTVRVGATVDATNRDGSVVLPQTGVELERADGTGTTTVALDYAGTSQVPGYTALNSPPSGLFGGNASLGRERAHQLTLSLSRATSDWRGSLAAFARRDDDLVDWTYAAGAPFARQANAVDLEVAGVEALLALRFDALWLAAGYTYLDKDADYGASTVDASYYALNFAPHRATLAFRLRLTERLELRLDNEYRVQEPNPLRTNGDEAYLGSIALAWEAPDGLGPGIVLTADNLTDSDFQHFPGTPAMGRQISVTARYGW